MKNRQFRLPELVEFASSSLGIPESDIKSTRWVPDYDAYWVLLWNKRKLLVTGLDFYKHRKEKYAKA